MTSTFKLTKAEFKKIFKRPSIFIMAVLLVVTILISMSIFHPSEIVDNTIIYSEAINSEDYYNYFYDELTPNSKSSFDLIMLETDKSIDFYESINNNANLLTNYCSDTIASLQSMADENNSTLKDQKRKDAIKNIEYFMSAYKSLDSIKDFNDIIDATVKDYTFTEENGTELISTTQNIYSTKSLSNIQLYYNKLTNESYSSEDLSKTYYTDELDSDFQSVLNDGINFINTTIKGFVNSYDKYYVNYMKYTGMQHIQTMKAMRANLLQILTSLDEYLELLVNYKYPIVIINHDAYLDLNQKLDEAIATLTLSNVANDGKIDYHNNEVKTNLKKGNLLPTLEKLINNTDDAFISQVKLTIGEINELRDIQKKVNENKKTILDDIKSKVLDESISNISKSITNYSLLTNSYSNVILDKILFNITEDYDSSKYSKFYGYNFNEFNKYEVNERITINNYYINNNQYSNSYVSNFSYNQNSGTKTNAYDYMYFTLELCTLIIIVFAMMLVCNLITGETESGTIKLLLVRPYKRSKIITAKLLATIFFILTFMLFSGIITYIGGSFVYGDVTTNILAVFNSNTAFEISPLMLMLLNIITLTFDIIFYVLLALMISILCKNYAASISCTMVLLIANYALNMIFGGAFWYSLLPGVNLHLFKYLGNSFITATGTTGISSVIKSLLITGIQSSMTFWYSICMSLAYSIVFLAISYSVFQKRDF